MKCINSTYELGICLQDLRKSQNISQVDLSKAIGMRQATVSKMENTPDGTQIETLFKVLASLGYDLYIHKKGEDTVENQTWGEQW